MRGLTGDEEERLQKGMGKLQGMVDEDMFIILIVVMALQMYTYVQNYQTFYKRATITAMLGKGYKHR